LAVTLDGTLFVATADGLYRRALDGTVTEFGLSAGLPSTDLRAVAVHPDGRVLVGTSAGLAVGVADGNGGFAFSRRTFGQGLPGRVVYDVVISPDNAVWVRADDGVGQLLP
jgi:ligand-binding sensor domain-containing protein